MITPMLVFRETNIAYCTCYYLPRPAAKPKNICSLPYLGGFKPNNSRPSLLVYNNRIENRVNINDDHDKERVHVLGH